MVDGVAALGDDAAFVGTPDRNVDGHGHWTDFKEVAELFTGVFGVIVGTSLNRPRTIIVACTVLGSVGEITLDCKAVVYDVLVGRLHPTPIATLISVASRAFYQILLRQSCSRLVPDQEGTLDGPSCSECPA
jgi:hypothetical protein